MPTFTHCLRPALTERLVEMLQHDRSFNLFGAEGTGRLRLLQDLQECRPNETSAVLVNMKSFQASYDGMLRAIWVQLGRLGERPQDLAELCERAEYQARRIWLLLHNFDALLDNSHVDPRYNVAFYDTLNGLQNQADRALVCITRQPHTRAFVFADGKPYRSSWLDLEVMALPTLKHEEIVLEVQRRDLPLTRKQQHLMIRAIRAHRAPYRFLEFVSSKALNREQRDLAFPARLLRWDKELKSIHPRFKSTFIITVIGRLEAWKRFLQLDTRRVNLLWKIGLTALVFLLSAIGVGQTGVGKVVLDLLQSFFK